MVKKRTHLSPLVFISVVATVLKLLGLIDWEWWVVLLPFAINLVIKIMLLAFLGFFVLAVNEMEDEDDRR